MPKRKHASENKKAIEEEEKLEELVNQNQNSPLSSDDDAFPSEEEHDEESSEDDEDGEAFESIDVDFLCADPEEDDFHGLKTLLTNYLDGKQFSSSELVDAIIANPAGSVIKCGEDDDAIGVASVLQLSQHTNAEFLAEIKDFVIHHCPKGVEIAAKLKAAFASASTALLISERLLNCPPQIGPPLMESLIQEAEDMVKESGSKINQYIFITRAYADPTSSAAASSARHERSSISRKNKSSKKEKKKVSLSEISVSDLIFATPEGEFLANKASIAFSFAVPNKAVGKDDLLPHRVVVVVPAKEVRGALREMRAVVGG
jgi:protein BCP1